MRARYFQRNLVYPVLVSSFLPILLRDLEISIAPLRHMETTWHSPVVTEMSCPLGEMLIPYKRRVWKDQHEER